MRTLPVLLLAVMLTSVAFAGCFGGDKATPAGEDPGPPVATAGDQTGAMKGTLVTANLETIAGGQVGLLSDGAVIYSATADAQGRYAVSDVEPGEYRVQATGVCCKPAVRQVTITAGEVSDINFQLELLSANDMQTPYVDNQDWAGMISCAVAGIALCGIQGDIEDSLDDPNDRFMTEIEVKRGLKSLVIAIEWNAVGGAFGQNLNLLVENDDCDGLGCSYTYGDVSGPSPLEVRVDNDDITADEWKWDAIQDNRTLQFRVFPGEITDAMYQQAFTVYYDAYYWEEAPEGASALPDG